MTFEQHQQIQDVAEVAENSSFGAIPLESVWSQVIRRRPDTSEEIFEEAIKLLLKKGNLHPDFCSLENFRASRQSSRRGTGGVKKIRPGQYPLLDRIIQAPDFSLQDVLRSFNCEKSGASPDAVADYFLAYREAHPFKAAHEPYSKVTYLPDPPQRWQPGPKPVSIEQTKTIIERGQASYARWKAAGAGRMARFEARAHSAKVNPALLEHWADIARRDMDLTGASASEALSRVLATRMGLAKLELIGAVMDRLEATEKAAQL
jgi:hypothetical protein